MPESTPQVTATVTHHLSAPGGFADMSAEAAGLDRVVAGEPASYYRKDLISEGEYVHPTRGFTVPTSADRIRRWADNGNKMLSAGVRVPINVDHSNGADDARGKVVRFEVGKNDRGATTLYGLCQLIGTDAALTAARNDVSVGINGDYTDGVGRSWGDSIVHVALTPVPVVPGQGSFQALSQAGGKPGVLHLSNPGTVHKHASTQVQLPPRLAEAHRRFTGSIPAEDLVGDDDGNGGDGREFDPHATVRYGLKTDDPRFAHAALHDGERRPARVTLGKAAYFPATAERPSDVLHLSVDSPDLHDLNGRLRAVDHVDTHPTYTPHVTLAYLEPGAGAKYDGADIDGLTGESFDAPSVRFSGRDGSAADMSLTSDDLTPVGPEPTENPATADMSAAAAEPATAGDQGPTTKPANSMKTLPMSDAVHDRLHELTPGLDKVDPGDKAACISQHMHNLTDQVQKLSMDDADDADTAPDVAEMSQGGETAVKAAERIAAKRKAKLAAAESAKAEAERNLSAATTRADAAELKVKELSAESVKKTDPEVLESRAKLAEQEMEKLVAAGSVTPAVKDALLSRYVGSAGKYNTQMLSRTAATGPTGLDELVAILKQNVMVPGETATGPQNLSLVGNPLNGKAAAPDAGDIMAAAVRTAK